MNKQHQSAPQSQTEQQPEQPRTDGRTLAALLDRPIGEGGGDFYRFLTSDAVLSLIEERLPSRLKGISGQLVARAKSHFTKRSKGDARFRACTCKSLIEAICEAAELGFALDGQMCYAVPYGDEAAMQPSYRGMLAVARRGGLLDDAWARVVMPQDRIRLWEQDGVQRYEYEPDLTVPRNYAECVGVLAVAVRGGANRWEWMTRAEVDSLRQRSKAAGSGPWITDPEEMAKKAGLRRLLKMYSDDPEMSRLFAADDHAESFASLLAKPMRTNGAGAVVARLEALESARSRTM